MDTLSCCRHLTCIIVIRFSKAGNVAISTVSDCVESEPDAKGLKIMMIFFFIQSFTLYYTAKVKIKKLPGIGICT